MQNNITDIFISSLHKLNLMAVKPLSKHKLVNGRLYYEVLGVFEFFPPKHIFDDVIYKEMLERRDEVIERFQTIESETSNNFRHRYTKRVIVGNKSTRKYFDYIFDVVPENVTNYTFDADEQKMYLSVKGYGI